MTERPLNDRQNAFISEYLQCWNATQAALKAGYSAKTAYSIGSENLKKPEIRAAIEQRLTEMAMSANEALARLAEQARADMTDFVNEQGFIDLKKAQEHGKMHLIKKITNNDRGISIELHDSQSALVRILNEIHLLQGDPTSRVEMNVRNLPDLPDTTVHAILTD